MPNLKYRKTTLMTEISKKILIAEDDILLAIGIESIVRKLGHQNLMKCSSGEKLIETARKFEPDLIIADILLNDSVSGIEAIKEVRKTNPGVSVIYVTADSDPMLKEKAKEETGFVDYFVKPIDLERLKKDLETIDSFPD